ncbi:latent-transforming growth factor beta-binding protein 1, partial [Elysia marginata]
MDCSILVSLTGLLVYVAAQPPHGSPSQHGGGRAELITQADGFRKFGFANASQEFPPFNGEIPREGFFPLHDGDAIPKEANGFFYWPESEAVSEEDSSVINNQLAECESEDNPCEQICYRIGVDTKICDCHPGYALLPDARKCRDLDECLLGLCGQNGLCVNTPGSYICTCNPGFAPEDDGFCNDLDECQGEGVCAGGATCRNFPGSFVCLCPQGFNYDEEKGCQ